MQSEEREIKLFLLHDYLKFLTQRKKQIEAVTKAELAEPLAEESEADQSLLLEKQYKFVTEQTDLVSEEYILHNIQTAGCLTDLFLNEADVDKINTIFSLLKKNHDLSLQIIKESKALRENEKNAWLLRQKEVAEFSRRRRTVTSEEEEEEKLMKSEKRNLELLKIYSNFCASIIMSSGLDWTEEEELEQILEELSEVL